MAKVGGVGGNIVRSIGEAKNLIWVLPNIGVKPPKSSILIGVSIIKHPFWGTPIFGNTHVLIDFVGFQSFPVFVFGGKSGKTFSRNWRDCRSSLSGRLAQGHFCAFLTRSKLQIPIPSIHFNTKYQVLEMASKDVVKVALVGLGRAGHFHMESVLQLPGSVRLAWVIDVDAEKAKRIAAEKGCKWSNRLDEALEGPDAVDAVVIASATDTHFPYIMQALRADKAVMAEKPISHELHEVEEAVQLAKNKNLAFVCGYQRRADRHFRELKRQLDAGAIGNLKLLKTCSRDNPIPPMEYLRTSGGIFHDMLIHDFDMLDFLSGGQVPESVTATGHSYHREIQDMGDVDICAVMFKYPSGLIAMVDTSRDASYGYDQRIEAFGEKGMLTAKNELTSTIELATADGHLMPPAMYSFPQRYHQAWRVCLSCVLHVTRFI